MVLIGIGIGALTGGAGYFLGLGGAVTGGVTGAICGVVAVPATQESRERTRAAETAFCAAF